MSLPTQDALNAAILAWFDSNIGIAPISENTDAYNLIKKSLPALGSDIFNSIDDMSEAFASDILTFTAGTIADDKIELGGVYYVPSVAVTGGADGSLATPWKVAKGADATAFLANLRKAINASGVAGTDYSVGLTANPFATGSASDATTLTARAAAIGAAGNAVTASVVAVSSADGFAWATATLAGGAGDDEPLAMDIIDDWRDSLRTVPLEGVDDLADTLVQQLDDSVPALKTAVAALYT